MNKLLIQHVLRKLCLLLPPGIAKPLKYFYYHQLNNIAWLPRNLAVSCLRPFFKHKILRNLTLFEQKYYSQSGEDGILRTIFDKLGTTNKFAIEFGVHLDQGNTLLLKKKGWTTLLMDGNGDGTIIKKEFITPETVENTFLKYSVPQEPDLLSIDIDSHDYWVWNAITHYSPRVVVIEYNANIPPTESKTIPYDPAFVYDGTDYYGASLLALEKIGREKGYTLIYCTRIGTNAFFVRDDLVGKHFLIKPLTEIYNPPRYGRIVKGKRKGYQKSNKEMITV